LTSGAQLTSVDHQIVNEPQGNWVFQGISSVTASSTLFTNANDFVSWFSNLGRCESLGYANVLMRFNGTNGTLVVHTNSTLTNPTLGDHSQFSFSTTAQFHGSSLLAEDYATIFNYEAESLLKPIPVQYGRVFYPVITLSQQFDPVINGYFNDPASVGRSSPPVRSPLLYQYNNSYNNLSNADALQTTSNRTRARWLPYVSYITRPVYTSTNPRVWASSLSIVASSTSLFITPFFFLLALLFALF